MDNLVPLITNLATKNKHYVVFAGAGLSRDADVMSGWDILIETLKPLFLEERKLEKPPEDYTTVIEEWYLKHKTYKKMGYSDILKLMYEGDVERREYLKKFFIDVIPGESHKQLAQMVNNQLIRFIFTTNFDDLIEKALDELGINDYDVISNDDQLNESYSWDKVNTCRIYKLHGDYRSGKIRNTIEEVKELSPAISEDFQYIINRHGMITIGYAGRDEGVMGHFLNRAPFPYPFYWQYKTYPSTDDKEFKLFHELVEKNKDKHGREIHFIENESASNFLNYINEGISRHERFVIPSVEEDYNYKNYIVDSSGKKLRAQTIDIHNRFNDYFKQYIETEEKDPHYMYKFEVFTEFLSKISFIFYYMEGLITYDEDDEAEWLLNKLIKSVTAFDWYSDNEFMKMSTPYYLLMNIGALFLQYEKVTLISKFFEIEYKSDGGNYRTLMKDISYQGEGWTHVGQEQFKKNFHLPKYTIIEEHLLPSSITIEQFNIFDAYVTLYIVFNDLGYYWVTGSAMRWSRGYLTDVYHEHFKSRLNNKSDYENVIEKLSSLSERLKLDLGQGVNYLIEALTQEASKLE